MKKRKRAESCRDIELDFLSRLRSVFSLESLGTYVNSSLEKQTRRNLFDKMVIEFRNSAMNREN